MFKANETFSNMEDILVAIRNINDKVNKTIKDLDDPTKGPVSYLCVQFDVQLFDIRNSTKFFS